MVRALALAFEYVYWPSVPKTDVAISRREILRISCGATVGVIAGLAGCQQQDQSACPRLPTEPDYKDWLDGVSNYEWTCDLRGQATISVYVGVRGNIDYFKFGPPAVAISPGTNVVWEWSGRGGAHNVVSETTIFDSGPPVDHESETFSYTFDHPGVYRYVCTPHVDVGMKGVVFVSLSD